MAIPPAVLPASGQAAWEELAAWWPSRYQPSTQQRYATYLPRWMTWRAGRGLDPLAARRADVELWLHVVAGSGPSRASIAGHYDAVASSYRPAFDDNLIATNPCARIARPKVLRAPPRREVLTVLKYAAFLTAARTLGPTHHAIAALGGMLGPPASEMAGLTVDSLTTVRGYVTLTFLGQGDKPARVPVPLPALPAVRAGIDGRTSGPLLRTRTGAGIDRRSVHRYVAHTPPSPGSADRSARTRCGEPSARSASTRAFRCATRSACCATPAPRPPWPATPSPAMTSSGTPPTKSPASWPAEPADPRRG